MADSLIDNDQTERAELEAKWKDKSADEVLKAKVESDLYIKTLTARLDGIRDDYLKLREESTAKASLEELISRQERLLANPDTIPPTQEQVSQPSLKPEEIEAMLEQKLTARERANKQTENFNYVRTKLKEQYGDNASAALKQRMDTLGLDQGFVDELAKNHPSVFLKTFMDQPQRQDTNIAPPRNTVRQDRFAPVTQKRDWNYYQELNKRDPRAYLDPKIAIQMHNDAIALGDDFGLPKENQ